MSATGAIGQGSTSVLGTRQYTHHLRLQHSVGQGFFHTATVASGAAMGNGIPEEGFRYVVDCGSTKGYRGALQREVNAFRALVTTGVIDVLVLTHMHDDHVIGVPDLLATPGSPEVDTIMLPFIEDAERLMHFAAVMHRGSLGRNTKFYREFVIDPAAALRPYGPRRIIFVRAGLRSPDGGAPGGERDIRPAPVGGPEGDPLYLKGDSWYVGGPSRIERESPIGKTGEGRSDPTYGVFVMDDRNAMVTASPGGEPWLLAPFLDAMVNRERTRFLGGLARELGLRRGALAKLIANPVGRRDLVMRQADKLRAAYDKLGLKDLNLTSLCILSTPVSDRQSWGMHELRNATRTSRRHWHALAAPVAWMGTGDSDLKNEARRSGFLRHYRSHLHKIHTLALPHHGSENNFHSDLLVDMAPQLCTVAADRVGKWRHPASSIVQDIASAGIELRPVTSSQLSGLVERFDIKWA